MHLQRAPSLRRPPLFPSARRTELYAHRTGQLYVLTGIAQLSGGLVAAEHLYLVGIPTGYKQVFPVGRDREAAGVAACTALPYPDELPARFYPEEGDALRLQACAGIDETAVRADVDVRPAPCMGIVGKDGLRSFQFALGIVEDRDAAREFAHEVSMPAVGREDEMARP